MSESDFELDAVAGPRGYFEVLSSAET